MSYLQCHVTKDNHHVVAFAVGLKVEVSLLDDGGSVGLSVTFPVALPLLVGLSSTTGLAVGSVVAFPTFIIVMEGALEGFTVWKSIVVGVFVGGATGAL